MGGSRRTTAQLVDASRQGTGAEQQPAVQVGRVGSVKPRRGLRRRSSAGRRSGAARVAARITRSAEHGSASTNPGAGPPAIAEGFHRLRIAFGRQPIPAPPQPRDLGTRTLARQPGQPHAQSRTTTPDKIDRPYPPTAVSRECAGVGHGSISIVECLAPLRLLSLAPRLTLMRSREVNQRIERLGGVHIRQVGSHRRFSVTWTDEQGITRTARTTVQQHNGRDIPTGTLRAIERDLEPAFGKGWLL